MGGSTVVSLVLGSTFFRVTDDTNCPSETFVCNERKLQLVKASGAWENGGHVQLPCYTLVSPISVFDSALTAY